MFLLQKRDGYFILFRFKMAAISKLHTSQHFPHFPYKIQRHICNISILPITAFGKADRIFGLMVGNISFERRGGFVFPALHFNGNDLRAVLQYKINFTVFVGIVTGLDLKLSPKLLQAIIFSQRSFELVVCL